MQLTITYTPLSLLPLFCTPSAAKKLAVRMVEAADGILAFPYANTAYTPIRPLKHEYRKLLIENYIMYYWIDEKEKAVIVARVIYARRNQNKLL